MCKLNNGFLILVGSSILSGCMGDICGYYSTTLTRFQYKTCSSSCCGQYGYQYCCPTVNWTPVIVGSVIGGLILVSTVFIIIICCIQQKKQARTINRGQMSFRKFRPQYPSHFVQGKISPDLSIVNQGRSIY